MKRALITLSIVGIALPIFAAEPAHTEEWKFVKQAGGVTIYGRPHPGSHLKEFKAIGEINAPGHTVYKVIDDYEAYPSFMPYTAECRVLARHHDSVLAYQRISPKIISDRDYTIRIDKKSWPSDHGQAYSIQWKQANEKGPHETHGVFRVKVCDGSWLVEPAGPHKTRATYHVFTDSGVNVPPFVANTISATGIIKLFTAVRKQAANPKYRAK
jgi:ribosome-associated toxin RatA of RatAB toxin-antitoxin module